LLAIEFDTEHGTRYRGLWGANLHSGRWKSGGSSSSRVNLPRGGEMWANVGGWWGGKEFAYGGWAADERVRRVRLVDSNGATLDDEVEHGVILLLGEQMLIARSSTVEFYDAAGTRLAATPIAL